MQKTLEEWREYFANYKKESKLLALKSRIRSGEKGVAFWETQEKNTRTTHPEAHGLIRVLKRKRKEAASDLEYFRKLLDEAEKE